MPALIAHATVVSFAAALVHRPQFLSERRLEFVLGGLRTGTQGSVAFYQPGLALGSFAGRLGRLDAGESLSGIGTLIQSPQQDQSPDLYVLVTDVTRLDTTVSDLQRDQRGGVLLRQASLEIRTRGLLLSQVRSARLEDNTCVANVTLGLSPQRSPNESLSYSVPVAPGSPPRLIPIELAAYGSVAERFSSLQEKRYISVNGVLQRRLLGGQRVSRIEVKEFRALHPQRAMI